jgi:type II secretory pathway component PulJ
MKSTLHILPGLVTFRRRRSAFSLVEIMVTVGLLSLIILGLLATFNQTQRAFRTSMTQTDVLESGRAVTDMMVREIEQMVPSHLPYATNFFAEIPPSFNQPLLQGLPGTTRPGGGQDRRTNVVQRFFLLSRMNTDWTGIGYQVIPDYPNAGIGTLYRYERRTTKDYAWYLADDFRKSTNLNRIADGVVHLRLRAFDRLGRLITPTNEVRYATNWWSGLPMLENEINYFYFASNALPATLELELGIMEGPILQRYRAFAGNPIVQWQYLSNHAANVHLFRQRIPVRNVDLSAYP